MVKNKEKLLITGGCGFVGKNILDILYEKYQIFIIDIKIDVDFIGSRAEFSEFDLSDPSKVELLKKITDKFNPNYVINLTSVVTAVRDLSLFPDMIKSNLYVLLNLYEALKSNTSLKLFVQFGSGEEYGNIQAPFKVEDREEPNNPYALVKQLSTNTTLMLFRNYNFSATVIRPANLYGNYQSEDKFIPYIENKLKNNESIEMTLGEQKRDFLNVKVLVTKLDKILKNNKKYVGKIINIGSGKAESLREIVERIKLNMKSSSLIDYGKIPYRENEIMDFRLKTLV